MMSSPVAPASLAHLACSTASLMPSQTTEEITGHLPSTALAVIRVTSARARGVNEKTSPVWPLVISATMPGWAASHCEKRRRSPSSMLKSVLKGTAIAGIIPSKLSFGTFISYCSYRSGRGSFMTKSAGALQRAGQRLRRLHHGPRAGRFEIFQIGVEGRSRDAQSGQWNPVGIEDGCSDDIKSGNRFLIGNRIAAPLDLLESHQKRIEIGLRRCGQLLARLRLQDCDLIGPGQPRQDGVTDRRGIGRDAAADPDIDAKPGKSGLDALDIEHVGPFEHADRRRFVDLSDQPSQNWPCAGAQVRAGYRIETEIEYLERKPKLSAVGNAVDIADLDQRVEKAKGGGIIDARQPRDLSHREFRLLRGERLKHPETLGQRLHGVLLGRAAFVFLARQALAHRGFPLKFGSRIIIRSFSGRRGHLLFGR